MFPGMAVHNLMNASSVYTIVTAQLGQRNPTGVQLAYFSDLLFCEPGLPHALPPGHALRVDVRAACITFGAALRMCMRSVAYAFRHAPLVRGILRVIAGRAEEEMGGVDTCRHIASVANEQAIGDGANLPLIDKAVSLELAVVELEKPVTAMASRGYPKPAPIRAGNAVNFRPETGSIMFGYNEHINTSHTGVGHTPDVSASRGLLVPIIPRIHITRRKRTCQNQPH